MNRNTYQLHKFAETLVALVWFYRLKPHRYDGKCRHQDFKNKSTVRFTVKSSRCKATCRQMTGAKPFDINCSPPKIRVIDDVVEVIVKNQ